MKQESSETDNSAKQAPRPKLKQGLRSAKSAAPRLLSLSLEYRKTLLIGLVALTLGSGINLLFPYLIRKVLNEEYGLHLAKDLTLITGVLIVLFCIQAFFFYVRHYCFTAVGYKIVAKLRRDLFEGMMRQDLSFFDNARVGDLLSRLASDTQLVQRAVTINISVALRYAIQVLGGVVLMLIISAKLTLIILLLIPLLVCASIFWGKKLQRYSRLMQEELGVASIVAEETLSAPHTVSMFTGARYEGARYEKAIQGSLETGFKRAKIASLFSSSMVFFLHSSIALVIWYGGTLILKGTLTVGDLTAFLLYGVIVAVSFGFLAGVWDEFLQAVGGSERIFEILDTTPKIVSPRHPRALSANIPAGVSFEKVSFAYPTRPEVLVLKEVSFQIPAGKTVALVGPSGAGKSTIALLIPRFYDPLLGGVSYGGIPLPELDPEELRAHISMVAQNPQVFSYSIGENIRYGKLSATQGEIEAAAKAANIHDFIISLPQAYDTVVGDRGVQLSGGERQRVAIARALLKDPKFLILDEATSALDSENEHLVQQALISLMKGRTSLIIAHRLSTVQHADIVLVLRNGEICQVGTHQELVTAPGLYQTLVEHQLL